MLSDVAAYDQLAAKRRGEALVSIAPAEGYTVEDFFLSRLLAILNEG